jgi:hypothetical protein
MPGIAPINSPRKAARSRFHRLVGCSGIAPPSSEAGTADSSSTSWVASSKMRRDFGVSDLKVAHRAPIAARHSHSSPCWVSQRVGRERSRQVHDQWQEKQREQRNTISSDPIRYPANQHSAPSRCAPRKIHKTFGLEILRVGVDHFLGAQVAHSLACASLAWLKGRLLRSLCFQFRGDLMSGFGVLRKCTGTRPQPLLTQLTLSRHRAGRNPAAQLALAAP